MLRVPCSLFLTDSSNSEKKVVTINSGNKPNFIVKCWFVSSCHEDQVLPSTQESLVSRLFEDPHVILEGHRLLKYKEEAVPSHLNYHNHPMSADTYNSYVDNFFDTKVHRLQRESWLWNEFVRIYFPHLLRLSYSLFQRIDDVAKDQRIIVSKNYPEAWLYWLKWRKYMMDFEGTPAELVFSKEYESYNED